MRCDRQGERECEDRAVGGRLLHQHQQRHQAQLLCGQGDVTMAQLVRTMYLLGLGYVLAGQLPLSGLQGAQHGELPSAGVCE